MGYKKIIGWTLFIIGLGIILWPLYHSYNIFTAKISAPEIFKIKEEENKIQKAGIRNISPEEFQIEIQRIIEEQIKEMIPAEFVTKLLNLISWSVFTGILIFGGGKVSAIGIRLIR